jgi:hypothetical protein
MLKSPKTNKLFNLFFWVLVLLLSKSLVAATVVDDYLKVDQDTHINVASWNIRQMSKSKLSNSIEINGSSTKIYNFIGQWYQDRKIDVLALQEFQEKTDLTTDDTESPLDLLIQVLPKDTKVLKGEAIREPTRRGLSSLWQDYCPIIYNSKKLDCTSSSESLFKIGYDYALGPQSELILSVQTPRYLNWAYCESKDTNFDFVVSCVHVNYKTSEPQILAVPKLIPEVLNQNIQVPRRLRPANDDFLFAGDFNMDRRSAQIFKNWGSGDFVIQPDLPVFPKQTRWRKSAFTKLKDIYTFTEARQRSTDIYDDVTHTQAMNQSLVFKFVDPLIDDYFINPRNNRVDMRSLLGVSDHLPVISTYNLHTDSD